MRGAIQQAGSKLIHVILNMEEDTAYLCARASTQLSATAWSKQLGVARLQHVVIQCTDGMEEAMRKCRAEWGLELESEERYETQARVTTKPPMVLLSSGTKRGSDNEDDNEPTARIIECDPRKTHTNNINVNPTQTQVEHRPLQEVLETYKFDTSQGNPTDILAWERFNQLAAFWYVRTGGEYCNKQHMPTVFKAMQDHPQSHRWWHKLASEKQAELAVSMHCAGVDQGLLRFLLEKRVEHKMLWKVDEVWDKFAAWAKEYAGDQSDTLHTRIQAMGTHAQSDIDWRRHAVKKNRYYAPAMCQ